MEESARSKDVLARFCPALLVLLIVALTLEYAVGPVEREFLNNDPDLSHPLKEATYGTAALQGFIVAVPIGTILLVHIVRYRTKVFALITVAQPRPNFLAVCELPDTVGESEYVSSSQCTGDEHEVAESMKSFLSGHASLAFNACVFAGLYASKRTPAHSRARVILPIFHTAMFALAALIANSRITDFLHFPVDVLCGSILGTAIATIGFLNSVSPLSLHWWSPPAPREEEEKNASESPAVQLEDRSVKLEDGSEDSV